MSLNETPIKLPLAEDKLRSLVAYSNLWALGHGLLFATNERSYETAMWAPHTLLPSPVPRTFFEKALRLQPALNELMWKVANDDEFLTSALKSTIQVDDFTARLFGIYKQVLREGCHKPVTLALLRSDYMLDSRQGKEVELKQVEINTIACGSGGLSIKSMQLHRATLKKLKSNLQLPANSSADDLCEGIVKAWQLYGHPGSEILFVVQDWERNIFDINVLVYKIEEMYPTVNVILRNLLYIGKNGKLSEDRKLIVDDIEVAVVYYRFGYKPSQYTTEMNTCRERFEGFLAKYVEKNTQNEWRAKLIIEQSVAAVCPSINWHLAGTKKVQQELSRQGVLEKYLSEPEVIAEIRSTFAGQYSLELTAEGDAAAAMGIANPQNFVMKPQREGGGNNLYGDDVRKRLEQLAGKQDRAAFILMDRIMPTVVNNYELRKGLPISLANMVSELGTFGVIVCKDKDIVINKPAGHLLRTKNINNDEGGIMSGACVLDSPYLT